MFPMKLKAMSIIIIIIRSLKAGNGGIGNGILGGIGGDGGNIFIKAKQGLNLKDVYARNLKKRYVAGNGENRE